MTSAANPRARASTARRSKRSRSGKPYSATTLHSTRRVAGSAYCNANSNAALLGAESSSATSKTPRVSVRVASQLAGTTIVAQGFAGVATLGSALWNAGPGMLLAVVALGATVVASRESLIRWTALGAFAFFLIEPFGFRNDQPQLATGASLRFALPALVLGLVGVLPLLRRVALPLAFGCLALAAFQVTQVAATFANDATTHRWYVAALVVGVAIVADALRTRGVATALAGLALVAYAVRLTGSHPVDYYDDLVARGTHPSQLFAWLANDRPAAVIGDHIRIGSIAVVSPGTLAINTVQVDPCGEARRADALLVIADDPPASEAALAQRRAFGRACGSVRYDDGSALVVAPSPPRASSK